MFQTFTNTGQPSTSRKRVTSLRQEMKRRGLDAFLVPRADEHQNEYVPPSAERLQWLSGFSGSAGSAIVLKDKAALFVDGRYTLQAANQVDTGMFKVLQVPENSPAEWLARNIRRGGKIGYDPRLHTISAIRKMAKALEPRGAMLVAQTENVIDSLWTDRPPPPKSPVVLHPIEHAGLTADKKIAVVRTTLRKGRAQATVLTLPDSIAWLLNIRGNDVPHTPLVLSFLILPVRDRPQLFIDPAKVSPKVRKTLSKDVDLRRPEEFESALADLAGKTVRIDSETASQWIGAVLTTAGASIVHGADPCLLPKAKKNKAEIGGARKAHLRDGIAMCRFLNWLETNALTGKLDEIGTAKKLEAIRADSGELKDISFDTISGAGSNGAIVHYRVTTATNARLEPGTLYLVDSGAQYSDGTTDITRTVAIGEPDKDMRRHYTLVLKGHLAISMARFPKGTRGADLDPLARAPLWNAGLDFDHGTGHGVGSYLSVHEGPQRISKLGNAKLEPGMILSNEPGYYRPGEYGIRIENLVVVTPARKIKGGERPMMGFETLTLAPYDRQLIEPSLLSIAERKWVDAYHRRVFKFVGPALKHEDKAWLEAATRPLEKP